MWMNNGRVRIYELSRELNLDNKDILAVCEQLDISVKSHSSTITESEAERIRTAAEKYPTSSSQSKSLNRQASSSQSGDFRGKPAPTVQKKQQILEIRRPPIRSNSASENAGAKGAIPPQPAVQPNSDSARPPAPPLRPARPASAASPLIEPAPSIAEPEVPAIVEDEVLVTEAENLEEFQPPIISPDGSDESFDSHEEAVASNQPELAGPPARPAPPAASTPRPALSNRPVLKRSKAEQSVSSTGQQSAPVSTGTNRPRPTGNPANAQRASRASEQEEVAVAQALPQSPNKPAPPRSPENRPTPKPQILELRAPRPARPEINKPAARDGRDPSREGGISEGGDGDRNKPKTLLEAPVRLDDLQRPTPPKAPKRGKGWEEEEETQEFAEKTAKAAAKGKRRTQVEDEDEDLDILLEEDEELEDAPIQVSLSLVRPTKPKSKQTQAKPAAATIAVQKGKKFTSSRDRRERREEAKQEKPTKIVVTGGLTVQELALRLIVPETDIIRALFLKGIAATVTQTLDIPTITMVAEELGVEVETAEREAEARKVTEMLDAADLENLKRRPPVVTIMGHVDHGKTTLLDSIRKTKVAQGEAGGITQHIGAYHVDVEHDDTLQQVVFLDTPGHEAFTAMRARGARVTDIAILVVAADDGVQPQTIEAISHAKAAEVPIVVAINKVDKEEAQPDRVKQELTEFGLVPEEWGGETIMVPVSAMTGENLDTLLEMLLLVAEVEDLYANPDRSARGTVIEAHLDKAKGAVATLLIQNGTLHVGDVLVAGSAFGKVRAMVDDRGKRVQEAGPSFAVEVLGLSDVPAAGDEFEVLAGEKEGRALASDRAEQQRQSRLLQAMASRRVSLNTLSAKAQEGELKELNLVLKADVQGSVEAILGALKQLPQNEVQVRVLYAAPGEVTETDVDLAAASAAVIIGFNTTLASGARQAADQAGVDVREYNIIYKLLDDIQGAMEGLLDPELVEEALGQAEVRAVFPVGRGSVAGCYILSGKVVRNSKVRVRRSGNVIHEANLDSLKRMKEDAREVNAGYECGIGVDSFSTWELGDIIESYRMATKRRTLSAK
jgi:translation initiation factor IF-2